MPAHDFDWFLQNEEAYNSLTVDQLHILGQGGTVDFGDTENEPAEDSTSDSDETPPVAATSEPEPEPVVLTKDGKHTIPFEEYRSAKDEAQASRERIAELEAASREQAELIENLKAAKTADAGTGDTEAQDEVLREFKEQYPELSEALAPALQKMLAAKDSEFAERLAAVERKFSETLAPIQQTAQDAAVENHFATINAAVPDFDALVESGEVAEWVSKLPTYARVGAERVLAEGTATEVVELFTQYKDAHKPVDPALGVPSKAEVKEKADAAISRARTSRPMSLSDVPAGQPQSSNEEPTTVDGWSKKFAGMDPDLILKNL